MKTREQWLREAVEELRPYFKEKANLEYPEKIRVSCGWPSRGGTSRSKRVLGQCWKAEAAFDGVTQIFISPYLREATRVLDVLIHELIHAALPDAKHGPEFRQHAKLLQLCGKPTATQALPELVPFLEKLAEKLGDYDNSQLDLLAEGSDGPKKQKGRMLKAYCPANEDHKEDYIVRLTQKQVEIGLPVCPCGKEMLLEEKPDTEGQ